MTKNFIIHGFYLLVVTSVAVMYNPHTNAFGFNPNAKSALIVGVLSPSYRFSGPTSIQRMRVALQSLEEL